MSVYDRPMFRKGGGAIGIMASGPELMKRFSNGGFNFIPSASANPVLTGAKNVIPQNVITEDKFKLPISFGADTTGFRDTGAKTFETGSITGADLLSKFAKNAEDGEPVDDAATLYEQDIAEDNELKGDKSGTYGQSKIKSSEEIKNEKTDLVNSTNPASFLKNFYKTDPKALGLENDQTIMAAKKAVVNASNKVAEGVLDFKDQEFVGGSYNKNLEELNNSLRKEGKEITLEDVYDEGIKLLGYDPRELDKNFNADRRQAFFMNLIKILDYILPAGGSKDAVSNVALGLAKGLEGFGADIGDLRDDLREDRNRATTVMFNLLKSKKSEQLAKEALDLDKKFKIFNISKMQVDEKREEELRKINADYEMKKFNLNFLIEAKKIEQKGELQREQIEATLKNTLLSNKSLVAPFMLGMIKPAEGYTKEEMDFFKPETFVYTEKGIQMVKDGLQNLRPFKLTDTQENIKKNVGKDTSLVV